MDTIELEIPDQNIDIEGEWSPQRCRGESCQLLSAPASWALSAVLLFPSQPCRWRSARCTEMTC